MLSTRSLPLRASLVMLALLTLALFNSMPASAGAAPPRSESKPLTGTLAERIKFLSHNAGGNFCLTQGHNVYQSASFNSGVVGWVSYYDVWHHYNSSGNWSLGYVVTKSWIRGYIPLGIIQYETYHDATRCH
ncbi:MAG TPA: hypothetical protein VFZ66_15215 [Herpetosiphonaceae bacterium]